MNDNPSKPLPVPNKDSQELFDGAKRGELMIQHCAQCGEYRFIARQRCDACGAPEFEWVAASGKGIVVSFAFVHQKYHPAFLEETPYNIAIVELEEGPRMTTNLVQLDGLTPKGGMPVEVIFDARSDEISVPVFRPVR